MTVQVDNKVRWKLATILWVAGMIGVVIFVCVSLPGMLAQHPPRNKLHLPLGGLMAAIFVQSGLFLAAFVWVGAAFAPKVGLRAPLFEALASGNPIGAALTRQVLPGVIGGLAMAVVPWYFTSHGLIMDLHAPSALLVAVFYGGITEELFMRWGLMSLLVWLGWRFVQKNSDAPSRGVLWTGIVVSAVIFGAGHLPATQMLNGHLTGAMIGSVIAAGAAFGVLAGYLYYRWGLESAMISHAMAHIFAYAAYKLI